MPDFQKFEKYFEGNPIKDEKQALLPPPIFKKNSQSPQRFEASASKQKEQCSWSPCPILSQKQTSEEKKENPNNFERKSAEKYLISPIVADENEKISNSLKKEGSQLLVAQEDADNTEEHANLKVPISDFAASVRSTSRERINPIGRAYVSPKLGAPILTTPISAYNYSLRANEPKSVLSEGIKTDYGSNYKRKGREEQPFFELAPNFRECKSTDQSQQRINHRLTGKEQQLSPFLKQNSEPHLDDGSPEFVVTSIDLLKENENPNLQTAPFQSEVRFRDKMPSEFKEAFIETEITDFTENGPFGEKMKATAPFERQQTAPEASASKRQITRLSEKMTFKNANRSPVVSKVANIAQPSPLRSPGNRFLDLTMKNRSFTPCNNRVLTSQKYPAILDTIQINAPNFNKKRGLVEKNVEINRLYDVLQNRSSMTPSVTSCKSENSKFFPSAFLANKEESLDEKVLQTLNEKSNQLQNKIQHSLQGKCLIQQSFFI